jgi:catalase
MAHFQQDGHMTTINPVGRVNYEPNSWPGDQRGPREDPMRGFQSYPVEETGKKRRIRAASFADHYSQARQFFTSQLPVEQQHIIDSFVFELSKVQRPDIRERMVSNLRNVDESLAASISEGLGQARIPAASVAAAPRVDGLAPSPALSILSNGPTSFTGRKVGVLVTDGASVTALNALRRVITAEGADMELIAPTISGAVLDDGSRVDAQQMLGGGPSVLYDAVAVLASADGAALLAGHPAAKDFVTDAHAHCKIIGYTPAVRQLFTAAGLADLVDAGYIDVSSRKAATAFLEACRAGRQWDRS